MPASLHPMISLSNAVRNVPVTIEAPPGQRVSAARFTGPSGGQVLRTAYEREPVTFIYDDRGYEHAETYGPPQQAVTFTPDEVGSWAGQWENSDGTVLEPFALECQPSHEPGFVGVSARDGRYFAVEDGTPYVPLGLNLCWPPAHALSTGVEFGYSQSRATVGLKEYRRWFTRLAENGGNFARLWLGQAYFQPEVEVGGALDPVALARIEAVVEMARERGIRLKMCLEYFRTFEAGTGQSRQLTDESGRSPADMDEWFTSPHWQQLWWLKVNHLLARWGDDPTVMAWELWNEIDCCWVSSFEVVRSWTQQTLAAIKRKAPRQLVTNSLGSLDATSKDALQAAFCMPQMDFQQVHRYVDQGSGLGVCHEAVAASLDAVRRSRRPDRPILLAETGAVNDNHTGPFRYYRWDDDGLLFHDTTYPAFFAGAAGSGHIWHWDHYVDQKNLWQQFAPLSRMLSGIGLDREAFQPQDFSGAGYWCLTLVGHSHVLVWLRNRASNWAAVLRDGKVPPPLQCPPLSLKPENWPAAQVSVYRPWPQDGIGPLEQTAQGIIVPPFRHGLLLRLDRMPAH